MASKEVFVNDSLVLPEAYETPVLLGKIKPAYISEFLKPFESLLPDNLHEPYRLPVQIREEKNGKFNPFLRLAEPEDGEVIAEIVKEIYDGTYPYKEMENPQEIARLIASGNYKFMVFLDDELKVIGSTCFVLHQEEKKGYLRSLVIKKEWCGKLDTKKAYITACLMVWNRFRDDIMLWWAETRTANAKTQSITRQCSLRPVAWFPNKDVFFNAVESDLLIIAYNRDLITHHRSRKCPEFISAVKNCFGFSSQEYGIEEYIISDPELSVDVERIKLLESQLLVEKVEDTYGYITVTMRFPDSSSYFTFLYTPSVQNFEKTKFNVKNMEELYVFAEHFMSLASQYSVRYVEVYLSAYNPLFQAIFHKWGLVPRGYIPGFKFNPKKQAYDDMILFNWYKRLGQNQPFPELIPEAQLLLNCIHS